MFLKFAASVFALVTAISISIETALPQDKGAAYEARYMLTGFLLRATKVCQGDERHIKIAFSLLDPDELKVFSKNFPKKVEEWMERGANNFNASVLKSGIPDACSYAIKTLQEADQIAKNSR
jgi:hypothetical protein